MATKLAVYASRAGVADVGLVSDAYHVAMQPRLAQLPDVYHYDMLHPARTALILIENTRCTDAHVLAAAQVIDTLTPALAPAPGEVAAALGAEVATLAEAVPDPHHDKETLIERLVTAERDVALIALAERLDHARHLHMRAESGWRAYFVETVAVYQPVAERLDNELYHRFERWSRSFQRHMD